MRAPRVGPWRPNVRVGGAVASESPGVVVEPGLVRCHGLGPSLVVAAGKRRPVHIRSGGPHREGKCAAATGRRCVGSHEWRPSAHVRSANSAGAPAPPCGPDHEPMPAGRDRPTGQARPRRVRRARRTGRRRWRSGPCHRRCAPPGLPGRWARRHGRGARQASEMCDGDGTAMCGEPRAAAECTCTAREFGRCSRPTVTS